MGNAGNADLKMVDIERVEVLRGPQGTLYGSGSMGGTVRVIPNAPNLQQIEGEVAARYSQTAEEGDDNTMVQGVMNIPLIEVTLAVRAVAYHFDNSGYINNVSASVSDPSLAGAIALGGQPRDDDDVGGDEYTGARLSMLWRPLEVLDIGLNYTSQDIEQQGIPEVNFSLAEDFQQVRLGVGTDGSEAELLTADIEITNLTLNYDLGVGSIFSSSSWVDYTTKNTMDLNLLLGGLPMYGNNQNNTEVFTQELRFASQFEGPLQVLVGAYYEESDADRDEPVLWSGNPALNSPALVFGDPAFAVFPSFDTDIGGTNSIEQTAFFAEASYQVTEVLEATVGVRMFDYEINNTTAGDGVLVGGSNASTSNASEKGENYKFNLSYRPNDDLLLYGQWAEGFRLGGPKQELIASCDVDNDGLVDGLGVALRDLAPDELESFELGLKSSFADNRVTVNLALYHINWDGMPVIIVAPCGAGFGFNAGQSESDGIELETQFQLSEHWHGYFSASYVDAKLTEDIPNVVGFGSKGDTLPGSSDYNISLGLEYGFTLAENDAFIRGDYSYVSEYYNNFDQTGKASGGFGQLNMKAGITMDHWRADIFVNNLTNEDALTWVESVFGGLGQSRANQLRPRTIGFNIGYSF